MTTKTNRQRLTAQIHIAKKDLGLDEFTYRLALKNSTGKSSCSDMDISELYQAIEAFKQRGWKPRLKGQKNRRQYSPKTRQKKAGQKTGQDKLRALWIDMHKNGLLRDGSERALGRWVKRMTARHNQGLGYESVDWVPDGLITRLIEDLKQWQQRLEAER